jgi:hypothetical protein
VVIVSEETGNARLAEYGKLSPPIELEEFRAKLLESLHAPIATKEEAEVKTET